MQKEFSVDLTAVRALRTENERLEFLAANPLAVSREGLSHLAAEAVELLSSDLEGCDDFLETLEWFSERAKDDYSRGRVLRAKANARYVQGRLEEAVGAFEEAANLFASAGEELDEAITYSSGLLSILLTGDHRRVEEWARRARSIFDALGDDLRLARLNFNYANVLFRRDRWEDAAKSYEAAYGIFKRLGSHRDVATCLSNMAVCQISVHNSDKAAYFYSRARSYCESHGLAVLTARIDYNYAYLFYLRGEYTTSLELFEQARERCIALGDQYHPVLCNLDEAEIYLELNLTQEATTLASRAHQGFESLGMPYESAKALTLWAIAVGRQGKWIAALEMLQRARSIFEREENEVYKSQLDLHSGIVLLKAGRPFEAIRLAKRAQKGLASLGLQRKEAQACLLICKGRLDQRHLDEAETELRKAFSLASGPGSATVLWQAHYLAGRIDLERGDRSSAERAFRLAHESLEEIRSHVRTEEQKIPLVDDKLVVYEELVVQLASETQTPEIAAEAFKFVEKAKARSLSDMVATRAATLSERTSGRSQLASQVSKLREELNWYYRQIDLQEMRGDAHEPGSMSPLLNASERYEADLLKSLGRLSSTDREVSSLQEALVVDPSSIQELLSQDEVILDFYEAKGVMYVATLDQSSAEIIPATLSSIASDLYTELRYVMSRLQADPDTARSPNDQAGLDLQHLLERLFDELISPIAHRLKPKLVVVPCGALFHLPFHALNGPIGPLSKEHQVTYSPSATTWFLSRSREASSNTGLLVAFEQPRISTIEACFRNSLFRAATSPNDFVEEAREARTIFADGSASYRPDNPMFSTLRIAGKDYSLFDLLNLDLDAQLFVLSGFQQTSLAASKGDEVFGLYRTLLYAGSRAIVHNLWRPSARAQEKFVVRHWQDWPPAPACRSHTRRRWTNSVKHSQRSSRVGTLRSRQLSKAEECSIADLA